MDATTSRRLILTFVISLAIYAMACFSPIAWSPDSRWIAFTVSKEREEKGPDGKAKKVEVCQLWAWDTANDKGKLLAEGWALSGPAFTPDGRRVVFAECLAAETPAKTQGEPSRHAARLASIDVESGQRSALAVLPEMTLKHEDKGNFMWDAPSLSPDAKRIVVPVFEGKDPSIYLIECASGQANRLMSQATHARWSPDGNWVCFDHQVVGFDQKSPAYTVEAMQVDTRKRVSLGEMYLGGFGKVILCPSWLNFSWSSDSKRVAYTSFTSPRQDEEGQEAVYIAELDGARAEFLRGGKERLLSNPVWSPNGTQIAMSVMLKRQAGPQMGTQVVVLDYPSKKASVLAEVWPPLEENAKLGFTMPSWSPDGRWIAVRIQGQSPVIVSTDGKSKKWFIYDEHSAGAAWMFEIYSLKSHEVYKRFSQARKEAEKALQLVDDISQKLKQEKGKEVRSLKLYPLLVLNRFEDVINLGKESKDPQAVEMVKEAHLALGQYDQVKDADKDVRQAQELEKKAADSKEPAESARLWLQAGNVWYEKLLNKKMSIQAYANAAKALPGGPEAKTAQEKIAEVKARFAVE